MLKINSIIITLGYVQDMNAFLTRILNDGCRKETYNNVIKSYYFIEALNSYNYKHLCSFKSRNDNKQIYN